jgi:hypothetical protein
LVFKPVRPITEEELDVVRDMRDSVEAEEAVKLTVAPSKPKEALFEEKPAAKPAAKPAPKAKAEPAPEVGEDEPPVEAPKKAASKKPEPASASLESLVDGWDDE